MYKYNVIDLFAGAGGMSLGLNKAGFRVVLANEIESSFCETYMANHLRTKMIKGDIHKLEIIKELKKIQFEDKIHLVCGGPPCQGFSTVGKKNFYDPRNSLFIEFVRIVKEVKPDFIFFENVSGFKKMYDGFAFNSLLEELDKLNYNYKHAILDAANFGLPQFRKRTIVIGFKKIFNFNFPNGKYGTENNLFSLKSLRTLRDAISDLPQIESGETSLMYSKPPLNDYQKELRGKCVKLTDHSSPNHGSELLRKISFVPEGGSVENIPKELRPRSYYKNTYARLLWNKPTPTLTRNFGTPSSSRCIHPEQNRGLTTREGARIQGFPDSYVFVGSRSEKNLQIGNAVPPIFGYEIGREILRSLKNFYEK